MLFSFLASVGETINRLQENSQGFQLPGLKKNYKEKFQNYLSDPENSKWKEIAEAGCDYTMKNLTNYNATEKLVEIFEKLI